MVCAERQYIYDEIVKLTKEIGKLSLSVELANLKGPITRETAIEMVKKAEKENSKLLNSRISEFIRTYRAKGSLKIFGKDEGFFRYNPEEINPLDLLILFLLTYGRIKDNDLFCCHSEYCDTLEKYGYRIIAKYLRNHYLQNVAVSESIYKIFSA